MDTAQAALDRDLGLLAGPSKPVAKARGTRNGNAKLTAADVLAIRARVVSGETQRAVADEFCVQQAAVGKIVRRERWGWLK